QDDNRGAVHTEWRMVGKKANSKEKRASVARSSKEMTRVQAEEVLADPSFDEKKAWLALLEATTTATSVGEDGERKQITVPDYRIRMTALMYLTDKAHRDAENKPKPLDDPRLAELLGKLLPPQAPAATLGKNDEHRSEPAGASSSSTKRS